MCNFRNICYSHADEVFVMIKNDESFAERNYSLPVFYFNESGKGRFPVILRTDSVNLTTAVGAFYPFQYLEVSSDFISRRGYQFINYLEGKYLLYHPFVQTNIMHFLHDDLLPIFTTMSRYDDMTDVPVRTLVAHSSPLTYGSELLKLVSKYDPISQTVLSLEPKESLTCFEDMWVGLSRETVWYQYGFNGIVEGHVSESKLNLEYIKQFTDFVKKGFKISQVCTDTNYGVLFSRKGTRLILNEKDLSKAIAKTLDIDVIEVSMEHNSVPEIIKIISCAKFATGVHGSLLIFSMFLPQSSLLLELYPFAMNPNDYTTYRTLVSVSGMDVEYLTWRNTNRSNTVTHDSNHAIHGGINHLSIEEQERIRNSNEVPPHPCCYDPEFRFRLNQDTVVDIPSVVDILKRSRLFSMPTT
ncbi:Protein O-linked-mannose beta-1,4-N-acetylglucosaminyltransferase 2 [Holothuria leucospilota]|uniref:Protein O-linked-mannose beta-1,4-N-acetylglucosaminyltransferase 2 n=1 Tax=Holothuria leucospilota TaxID=206669 RepID=A0A9Q1BGE0_HOLLE|nr:Protein O-linked-mannose beta-1,4-N-acetylglucosaminyltransferase 2 [Holothuria leucospilota]